MKAKYIIGQMILMTITMKTGFCQSNYRYIDTVKYERYAEPHLSGELFEAAIRLDAATYFNQNWLNGDIIYTDGRIIRNERIRYNKLLDELFWLESASNQVIILDKEAIAEFRIHDNQGDTSVHFKKLTVKQGNMNDSVDIFVQELYHGSLSLYIFYLLNVEGRKTEKMNDKFIQKDFYTEEPVYYLKFLNGRVIRFREIRGKSFCKFMPEKKDEIWNYFRNSTLHRIRKQQDILNFIRFLSTIIDQKNP